MTPKEKAKEMMHYYFSFLLAEMRKIQQTYKETGIYCYELYTLMYGIALKENIPYGMDIHSELMNVA